MTVAKVFWSGRSQAVRLPKDFRFNADQVRIRRQGHAVILEPIEDDWTWVREVVGEPLDEDFVAGALQAREDQDRPGLDELFR